MSSEAGRAQIRTRLAGHTGRDDNDVRASEGSGELVGSSKASNLHADQPSSARV